MEKPLWRGEFERADFEFEGRRATVVFPREKDPGGRWLLKTEYFEAFQDLEYEMVKRGWHLAYLQNLSRWVKPGDLEAKKRFRDYLVPAFGLNPRCVPIGMSCGGLHAVRQAAAFPEMISALCLDAPVINLLSCPFGLGAGTDLSPDAADVEVREALGLTRITVLSYRDHPLDHIGELIQAKLPLLLMYGDADTVVRFDENGIHLKTAYEASQLPYLEFRVPGRGHHPHGPDTPAHMAEAIAFLETYGG